MVYGSSILTGEIIEAYSGRILNMHLGLSPYYRGSGTNFFPFVNNEPEYSGATYMLLNKGVDTGPVIHQIRPEINISDSFYQLSSRFLIKAFKEYIRIGAQFKSESIKALDQDSEFFSYKPRVLCKRSCFTEESVRRLHANFQSGMITDFLENYNQRVRSVPIVNIENNIQVYSA